MSCAGSARMYPRPSVVHTCVETVLDVQHCSFSQINLQILSVLHSFWVGNEKLQFREFGKTAASGGGNGCFRYKTKHDVSHFSASDSTSEYNTSHYFLHVQKCIIKYQMSKRLLLKSYFFRQSQNFVNRWRCSGLVSQMCSPASCISNSL